MNNKLSLNQEIEQEANLPVLPAGVSHLLKALSNDNINYADLANELEKFPTIAIKIVASANSAWATPISPITTLNESCSRIGLQLVRSISIALSVSQIFNPTRCPSFDPKLFWVNALLTAEAAHVCAKETPDVCADTARLTGLLHNMGLLWLAENKPNKTTDAISFSQTHNVSLAQTMSEQYNLDLYAVGGYLATMMELPDIIAQTIASSSSNSTTLPTDPLIVNHQYAQRIAASVLSQDEENEIDFDDDNPHYLAIKEKLPDIQSIAEALFFS